MTVRDWLRRVNADEPARLRAAWTAVAAVAAGVGLSVSADVDTWMQVVIAVVAAALPILQGETTRAKVTPVAKLGAGVFEDELGGDASDDDGEPL